MRVASAEAIGFTFDHDREPLSYCLIRVVTDNGIVGWGEACDSFGLTYASVIEAVGPAPRRGTPATSEPQEVAK